MIFFATLQFCEGGPKLSNFCEHQHQMAPSTAPQCSNGMHLWHLKPINTASAVHMCFCCLMVDWKLRWGHLGWSPPPAGDKMIQNFARPGKK